METPVHMAARLVTALDELIAQEGGHLRRGEFVLAAEVRERTAPLVNGLILLAGQPGVSDFSFRIATLVERSLHHGDFLQQRIQDISTEIKRVDQARHHATQLAPAYAQPAAEIPARFEAAG